MFRLSRVLCSYFSPPYKSFKETLIFFLLPWHVYCCSSLMEEEPSGQGFENNPCSHVHDPSSPLSRFPFSIVSLSLFSPYSLILCLLHTVQFSSVAQSGLTLCDPMDCSMPGLPVHHQTPEFIQTHVHWVSDAIQPLILCCPLLLLPSSSPSIRVFSNESALLHQVAKVLELQLQHQSFQWIFRVDLFKIDWFDLLVLRAPPLLQIQIKVSKKMKKKWRVHYPFCN